jgi:hypothetical protein
VSLAGLHGMGGEEKRAHRLRRRGRGSPRDHEYAGGRHGAASAAENTARRPPCMSVNREALPRHAPPKHPEGRHVHCWPAVEGRGMGGREGRGV